MTERWSSRKFFMRIKWACFSVTILNTMETSVCFIFPMKILLQRVSEANVKVDGSVVGHIGKGYLLFLGIAHADTEKEIDALVEKVLNLRIFENETGDKYFDKSIVDVKGEILVVSQFTLYAKTDSGRRPDFIDAAKPDQARQLYEFFVEKIRAKSGLKVETGQFQALMQVSLVNEGPTTLMMESK